MSKTKVKAAKRKPKDRNATVEDCLKLIEKMEREKEPQVPRSFLEESEEAIRADWYRRAAVAFLTKPFKEMAEKFRTNRDTAIAFAALSNHLPESIKRYEAVVDVLETAKLRIDLALCGREDMPAVLEEAKHG